MSGTRHLFAVPTPIPSRRHRQTRPLTFPELFQLPATVDITTAAHAFGFSVGTAYKLARRKAFPCRILRPGWRYRIPTMDMLRALGIDSPPVDPDDVATGGELAA